MDQADKLRHGLPTPHRIFSIPELLCMIFKSMRDVDNVKNAQVCKLWSDIALDALWSDTQDLHRLFNILSPISLGEGPRKESHYVS